MEMGQAMPPRGWWEWVRLAAAVLVVAALVAQAWTTIAGAATGGRDVATTTVNFFSFFTVLSNLLAAIALAWAGAWGLRAGRASATEPRSIAFALVCVTTYMIITGIVYNALLRGIPLPQGSTVPWSNEVLHVVAPIVLLLDLLVAPRRRGLGWGAVPAALAFPVAWIVYTLIRGPLTVNPVSGAPWWYPYPFLDPHGFASGYGTVSLYIAGIAVGIAAVAAFVVWVGRRRADTAPRLTRR
jgi:hypothetical protein